MIYALIDKDNNVKLVKINNLNIFNNFISKGYDIKDIKNCSPKPKVGWKYDRVNDIFIDNKKDKKDKKDKIINISTDEFIDKFTDMEKIKLTESVSNEAKLILFEIKYTKNINLKSKKIIKYINDLKKINLLDHPERATEILG